MTVAHSEKLRLTGQAEADGFWFGGGAGGAAEVGAALATVGEEEVEELPRRVDVEGVKDAATLTAVADQTSMDEFLEVERERGGRDGQFFGDLAGSEARLTLAGEQAEHSEAGFMRESGEGLDDLPFFHISTIV